MFTVAFVICFYCQNNDDVLKLQNCLVSATKLISFQSTVEVDLHITGYFETALNNNQVLRHLLQQYNIQSSQQNFGKSHNLNHLFDTLSFCDYIFYADGDIDFRPLTRDVFLRLHNISNSIKSPGLIVLNHLEDARHNLMIHHMSTKKQIENDTVLIAFDSDTLAYGCFFCHWKIVKNFKFSNVGCYGPEDTLFARKLQKLEFENCLVTSMHVIHPFTEAGTAASKIESIQKFII